ncbi:hypothetical protein ACFVHB_28590 [Kitasatospora sp. NPDC127111]|uniref:hypothetical protein n=1 Tax=Kitasatospora sp. NPDC127111 TaxID=3345363 RepID=UPI00362E6504
MLRIVCEFPITVSVVGTPTAEGIADLGREVEEALAVCFRQARQRLARSAVLDGPEEPGDPPPTPEREP